MSWYSFQRMISSQKLKDLCSLECIDFVSWCALNASSILCQLFLFWVLAVATHAHCSPLMVLVIQSISIGFLNLFPFDFLSSSDQTLSLLANRPINFNRHVAFRMILLMNFLANGTVKCYSDNFLCFFWWLLRCETLMDSHILTLQMEIWYMVFFHHIQW